MTSRQQARKRKREKDDSHELESQRRKYPNHDTYAPVLEGLNALALVSDAPGHTELDNAIAKNSVLKNSDLMAMTFSHLQVKNDKKSFRCLFNAALACKDFLDVALNALWEELDSLVPLLKLLPTLQVENGVYVCANLHVFYLTLFCL